MWFFFTWLRLNYGNTYRKAAFLLDVDYALTKYFLVCVLLFLLIKKYLKVLFKVQINNVIEKILTHARWGFDPM